jgi:endonuclease/exonuclease/phosphatase (EEP) superfamily protein YafD
VATTLGWLIVVFLGLIVFMRIIAWDKWPFFAEVDAAVEVLYLPAWLVLLGSLLGRRWWLAGAAALICAAQVVYVAPEVLASSPVPASVRAEPTIRLFDANVAQWNQSMSGYITQLRSYHPEVLAMEETVPDDYTQLKAAGVLATLPYQYQVTCCGSRGFIIASHYPLQHVKVSSYEGLQYLIRSTLVLPNRTINFWVVHTTAPTDPGVGPWNEELDGIEAQLKSLHPRPLLMVGDFNASWGSRGFRAILSTGLTDAAAARGDPFAFTWSQDLPILPPIIRIDHVLTAGGVTVTEIQTHPGPGSDHRDITATVATASAHSR